MPADRIVPGTLRVLLTVALLVPLHPSAADPNDHWWDGFAAPPAGLGMENNVWVLTVHNNKLVAGGMFDQAGGNTCANHIARFNGTEWRHFQCGMDGPVSALHSTGGDLYVGGLFTEAGWTPVLNVARWNARWHPMGAELNDRVLGFAEYGGDVVAVGFFTEADGSAGNMVARWDGAAWGPLGTGVEGDCVLAAAGYAGDLYVGGHFAAAGGNPATHLSRWDGTAWDDVGTTLVVGQNAHVQPVEALSTEYDGTLIVGGNFSHVNGIYANGLASWDGTSWTPLGAGLESHAGIQGIAVYNGDLVVYGYLTGPGDSYRIARWDGDEWQGFGSGIWDHYLFGGAGPIAVYDGSIYVGGDVGWAGEKESEYIARWSDDGTTNVASLPTGTRVLTLAAPRPNPTRAESVVEYRLGIAGEAQITIHDAAGRLVATLADGSREAGSHVIQWDGRTGNDRRVSSGIYFVRLTSAGEVRTRKLVVRR